MPWSRLKENIVVVLRDEGYLRDYVVEDEGGHKQLRVFPKYDAYRRPVLTGLQRVSRPSLRVYVKHNEITPIRRGLGVNILSTPKGVLPDRVARRERVGGEVLCAAW